MPHKTPSGGRVAARIATKLREHILNGKYPAGEFLPPVRELVDDYAVSKVTVNEALKLLAKQGLATSQPRQGYRVSLGATDPDRGFPLAYVNSTAHQVGTGNDLFYKTLLSEFQAVAAQRGWPVLTIDADTLPPAAIVEQIAAANCCGVITNTSRAELQSNISAAGIPTVQVDAWTEDLSCDTVLQDGFLGGLQAATHLIEQGHDKIAWLGLGPQDNNLQVLERYSGAHAGLARAGQSFASIVDAPLGDPATATAAAKTLLQRKDRPSAVLALWQDMTAALVTAARELDLVVGKDFDMVGWTTEEEYALGFAPLFNSSPVPPAVTWSISRLADAAVARLKQRRAEPQRPPAMIRIPTSLKQGTVVSRQKAHSVQSSGR